MGDAPPAISIPVLIIGGGSCGLSLSIFLSALSVEHVLFERHPGTSILPKAHIINQRSMEIFRQYGIAEEVVKQGTPPHQMSQIVWQTSLGGDGPLDRKLLGVHDTWGCKAGTERYAVYQRDAPHMPTNLPLLRLEPILRQQAEQRNPGQIHFNHKVISFEDKGDSVLVQIENKGGKRFIYRAKYVFGADGGKLVGPELGIQMQGPKQLRKMSSVHFKCDMSQYWDDRTCIAHFANPESGSGRRSGSMLPHGPSWGRHSEEWQMHFSTDVDAAEFSREDAKPRVRTLLKLPELELDVITVSNWVLETVLADSYRKGRVFIGGDATHRHPPTTGLGLNTAVQDAHNIAWKLSLVLKGKARPSILDTYEIERRPIGKQVTDWAFFTWKNHGVIAAAIGLQEGQLERNLAHFTALLDDTSEIGRASQATLQNIINSQVIEFGAHEMDLGLFYPDGCFASDGTPAPLMDPTHEKYTPTTRPGHRLPHVSLERGGNHFSTHDLLGENGDFLLITDRDGDSWVEASKQAAKARKIGLRIAKITGPFKGVRKDEYLDPDGRWDSVKGFSRGGAILVRPDSIIGWRALEGGNPDSISEAFERILGLSKSSANGHGVDQFWNRWNNLK